VVSQPTCCHDPWLSHGCQVVPPPLLASRFFSFIPAHKSFLLLLGLVELWVTRSVIQAPVRQPAGLSIRRVKSSSLKIVSYDTLRSGPDWSRAVLR
jgi:hypothetical protein